MPASTPRDDKPLAVDAPTTPRRAVTTPYTATMRRRTLSLLAAAVILLAACAEPAAKDPLGPPAPASHVPSSSVPAASLPPTAASENPEGNSDVRIHLIAGETVLRATLLDTQTARDFASLLPLTLTLADYAGTEKISELPRRLSTADAPPGTDPAAGDITYYAPWGNLAIFYDDFDYSPGLVKLGRIDSDIRELSGLGNDGEVTIEIAGD